MAANDGKPVYPEEYKSLVLPVIILRHGGLDGVAMQNVEYREMLKSLDMHIHIISGRKETEFGDAGNDCPLHTLVPELDFYHPDSQILFGNEFTDGPETEGIQRIGQEKWEKIFTRHKNAIRDQIEAVLESIPENTPVIVFNLLALRHAQPAAAVAIRELIEKYPYRGFISHAADPDAERPEKVARIKKYVLKVISAFGPDVPYSGGPYNLDNLYHVVLNPRQKEHFTHKYMIPENHVFEIPDFLTFMTDTPHTLQAPEDGFFDYLSSKCIYAEGNRFIYWNNPVYPDTVFFLSPVRPVARKQLKEAMLMARYYGDTRRKPVAFVVTHPNIDDKHYFLETVKFANALCIQYIHLGENFTIEKLEKVYADFASVNSVGVVASSAGGWENALNEMAYACIPFFMSSTLNSYKPLTERIGMKTFGMDFSGLHTLIDTTPVTVLEDYNYSEMDRVDDLMAWIDDTQDPAKRRELIEHNFAKAYKHLSQKATALRFMEVILKIYARHGLPGMPGVVCED
jgi:hypothetical protein